jgi:hypothetical protein
MNNPEVIHKEYNLYWLVLWVVEVAVNKVKAKVEV